MKLIFKLTISALFVCMMGQSAKAANPIAIPDLEANALEITKGMANEDYQKEVDEIFSLTGHDSDNGVFAASVLQYKGFKSAAIEKVYDKTYGTALRDIIYVAVVDSGNSLYQRFIYKLAPKGWVLSNYTIATTDKLFPTDWKFGP